MVEEPPEALPEECIENISLPADLSFTSDPQIADLQEFENRLASTGLYPGELSEQVVAEYGGQCDLPGPSSSGLPNASVVHYVNIARAVGVEVAQANHVLMKEMLDRQGNSNVYFVNFLHREGAHAHCLKKNMC